MLAVADLLVKTPEAAHAAYLNAMEHIPPPYNKAVAAAMYALTWAKGVAGVAAVRGVSIPDVAAQLEGKRSGGVIPGDPRRGDAYPYLLQAGEVVMPRDDFAALLDGIRERDARGMTAAERGGGGGGDLDDPEPALVEIDLVGEAGTLLTARQAEGAALGTL